MEEPSLSLALCFSYSNNRIGEKKAARERERERERVRSCFFAQSRAVTKLQPEPRNATISGRALVQVRTTRAQKHSLLEAPNRNDISSNFGIALKSLSARSPQRTKATLYIQYPFLQTLVLGDFESRKTEREGTCPCRNK